MEEPSKTPATHADLARDLRQSLDALGDVVEVCDVEDAAGLSFPSTDVKPDRSEVDRAKAQIPTTLAALAEMENRMRVIRASAPKAGQDAPVIEEIRERAT
jgi:hypothetical protein